MIENVENIKEFIHKDHCQTIHELIDTTGISYGVRQILTENLNTCHIATKFVPRLLTDDKKQGCINGVLSYERRLIRSQLLSLGS
jgi:hypothetical protein